METTPEPTVSAEIPANPAQTITENSETQQDRNWRAYREKMEQERKEKMEFQKKANEKAQEAEALKEALESVLNKNQRSESHNESDEVDEEEERIQKKVDKALEERDRRYQAERQKQEAQDLPKKLKQTYNDFDQVCSQENVDYFEYHHPEIAEAFNHMPDGFNKWAKVYAAIKKLIPNTSNDDKKKMAQNLNKPQSMAIPGITQVGDNAPVQLDDKRRAENYKRMLRVMKGG